MRLWIGTLLVALLGAGCAESRPESKPNVVVILADDQGWGDLSVSGNTNLSTPNIDSLARDGATLEHFYVSPVCSPTRAEFLTGRYHPRGGVHGTSAGAERLDLDEHTIAEAFRSAGYATGAFGKWHNGSQHPYHPNARGFDEYYGFTSGHWGHYFDPMLDHNGRIVRGQGYITDDLTEHAMTFIEERRDRPFFCYVAYNTPHSPMQVPDRFWEKFAGAELEMRHRDPEKEDIPHTRAALAMVENIDWNVGRLLRHLNELDLAGNTIVVYFSDNGPNGWRWNGGMKGRKGSIDEGGVRSPFFIRWLGRIEPGRRIPHIAAAVDLLPTLTDMAEIPALSGKPLDGVSIRPLLLGDVENWPDREILSFRRNAVSVRTQRFRLDGDGRLFDMEADPGQRTDVAVNHPEEAQRLRELAEGEGKAILAEVGDDDRPFPVGYASMTWLPARDAAAEGGIQRSNRFPNSSYFTNWTAVSDAITWDVEVGQAGEYEAVVYYACPAEDVGAAIELSFLDAKVRGKVTEAHDPPLIGAEEDRVPRQESYIKDFQPMSLGVISLAKGRGKLKLQAAEIPGKQVMELYWLTLTRRE